MEESNTIPEEWKSRRNVLVLPIFSGFIAILIIFLAFTKYKNNTLAYRLLLILSSVFIGIFASSFSNYIQTIELEKKQTEIISKMPIDQILKILEKRQDQYTKAKAAAIKNKFDK